MTGEKWTIFWNEHASDTYLYGAKLQFHKKDDVEYENLLMPPGTIIKKWYSKTNYQAQRIEPSPLLISSSNGELKISGPENCSIQFYSISGTLIGTERIENGSFTFPTNEKIVIVKVNGKSIKVSNGY